MSRALARPFFDAFVGNGNVRYLPNSEPVAVVESRRRVVPVGADQPRSWPPGCPAGNDAARVQEDVLHRVHRRGHSRKLLAKIGAPLVAGGAANKKRIVVSPLLETRQPNVYLAGDVLSPAYFETTEFDDPVDVQGDQAPRQHQGGDARRRARSPK